MIHLIENNTITQSWQSLPKVVTCSDGTLIHADFLRRSYGWKHLESQGLFREMTQSVELGENEYISGYTGPEVIDGKPYRVPVVSTKTQERIDQELAEAEAEAGLELIRNTPGLKALITSTQAQRQAYIDNNVTNLAQAKEFLKKLTDIVAVVAQREFR